MSQGYTSQSSSKPFRRGDAASPTTWTVPVIDDTSNDDHSKGTAPTADPDPSFQRSVSTLKSNHENLSPGEQARLRGLFAVSHSCIMRNMFPK